MEANWALSWDEQDCYDLVNALAALDGSIL